MKITLHQCRVFECVAHEKSITKAAKKMFLTQPAVSNLIKQLEESFCVKLIEVIGKTVHLTAIGEKFLQVCQDMRMRLEQFEYEVSKMQSDSTGNISIAVVTTAKYFIPRLLGYFKKQFPDIKIELFVVNRSEAIHRLNQNLDDFVVMSQPPSKSDLIISDFFEDSLVVTASANNPLAQKKAINLQDIKDHDWIIREQGSGTRMALDKLLDELGIKLKVSMEISNNESIKQLVMADMGLSIIPRQSIELEQKTDKIAILNVNGFPIKHEWYLVKNKGKTITPVVKTFLKFIEHYAHVNIFNFDEIDVC